MRMEYRGYTVDVLAHQEAGDWEAEVNIWPTISDAPGLRDMGAVRGYPGKVEAETGGVRWARERIYQFIS